MSTIDIISDNIKNDVQEILLDLPVHTTNKLRSNMLVSIFSTYGKYLLNKNVPFQNVLDTINSELKAFKSMNGSFCNANYVNKTIENIYEYNLERKRIKSQIARSFIIDSSTYLKKYIDDIDIVSDLEKAEETLYSENYSNIYTLELAEQYLHICKEKIKLACSFDPDFINML